MRTEFLGGRVTLWAGDCLEVARGLASDSVDAVVTDPPYALVNIGKRFSAAGAKPVRAGVYARAARGFMGKAWDTGDVAFAVAFWAEIFRVLKPGGHVAAFGGTRSYHRLACAIEDAGFEIRDQLAWAYGSGFPKSHDVSKGIDEGFCRAWIAADPEREAEHRAEMRACSSDKAARDAKAKWRVRWREAIGAGAELGGARTPAHEGRTRKIAGNAVHARDWMNDAEAVDRNNRAYCPATGEARTWQGFGTALKPAWEPIALARKPLSEGTVAANVLRWGCGAIHVEACRVGSETRSRSTGSKSFENASMAGGNYAREIVGEVAGRWPANLVHDGSDEVLAAFPSEPEGDGQVRTFRRNIPYAGLAGNAKGAFQKLAGQTPSMLDRGDGGSAARFFYSPKADADDRLGSRHPTVKPVDLMRWLARLVTPPGGTILDPFAGTGTTGEAAFVEGFSAVLIERELEYLDDIARRMALCGAGPAARSAASAKARERGVDPGPLFAAPVEKGDAG